MLGKKVKRIKRKTRKPDRWKVRSKERNHIGFSYNRENRSDRGVNIGGFGPRALSRQVGDGAFGGSLEGNGVGNTLYSCGMGKSNGMKCTYRNLFI